jgi:hypothetical protein
MVRTQCNGHLQNRLLAALPPKAFSLFGPGDYNYGAPGAVDERVWSETGCTCVLITSTKDVMHAHHCAFERPDTDW